jgi:hypothetical protein
MFEFQLPMCSLNPEFLKRDCGTIPVAEIISGKIEIKKKGYILSRDSEVTLSHWSLSIELVIIPLIDL